MRESKFQAATIRELKHSFPECVIMKNDSGYQQGIPDLLILFADGRWAALEFKRSETAKEQPNQRWFVDHLNKMSYAAFIYPENGMKILCEMHRLFGGSNDS